MSISDFESKKPIQLKFLHSTLKEDDLVVYINKNSYIKDLIEEVRTKLAPEKQNTKLRVLEVSCDFFAPSQEIYKRFVFFTAVSVYEFEDHFDTSRR